MESGVPEIDLAGTTEPTKRRAIVQAMRTRGGRGGFLVLDHGVARNVLEAMREQTMRVFALPTETKAKAMRAPGEFAGYGNGVGSKLSQSNEVGSDSVRLQFPGPRRCGRL